MKNTTVESKNSYILNLLINFPFIPKRDAPEMGLQSLSDLNFFNVLKNNLVRKRIAAILYK